MSKVWIIGTQGFTKDVQKEQAEAIGQGRRMAKEMKETQEALWQDELRALLRKAGYKAQDLRDEAKSAGWKVELAAAMKNRTTATNRWLGEALNMGGLHEVSRLVSAWQNTQSL